MAAALWNFRLNRRRDAALRTEEMASVATALYSEILLLQKELAHLATVIARVEMRHGDFTSDFVKNQRPSEPILYPALAPKLGLLPSNLLLPISRFYADFEEVVRNLPLLVRDEERQYTYSPGVVLESAVRAVDEITPALRWIERLAGIRQAEHPETGHAKDIIDMERERFET